MKKTFIALSSLAVVAALSVASLATGVFAADASKQTGTTTQSIGMHQRFGAKSMSTDTLKTVLSELVTAGTITQAQSDEAYTLATAADSTKADLSKVSDTVKKAIMEYEKSNRPDSVYSSLTDDQKTAVNKAVKSSIESAMASLVSDGTITQDQADKMISNMGNMGHFAPCDDQTATQQNDDSGTQSES